MRQVILGSALVALVIGWAVGRSFERTGRARRDRIAAKTTAQKAVKVAATELGRTIVILVLVGGFLVALFLGAMRWN